VIDGKTYSDGETFFDPYGRPIPKGKVPIGIFECVVRGYEIDEAGVRSLFPDAMGRSVNAWGYSSGQGVTVWTMVLSFTRQCTNEDIIKPLVKRGIPRDAATVTLVGTAFSDAFNNLSLEDKAVVRQLKLRKGSSRAGIVRRPSRSAGDIKPVTARLAS